MNSNIIKILGGKIHLESDAGGTTRSLTAYVCRPDRTIVCPLVGITRFEPQIKYNDTSQISCEVSRYITNTETFETVENPSYDKLTSFMGILVPELGKLGYFRLNKEPSVQASNTRQEKKSFTVESYESTLAYESLFDFRVNYGQEEGGESSLECYDDNVDAMGNPKKKITFYNPDEPRLSLLDLILENDTYGWKVGKVDRALYTMNRAFDVSNQNILSFLRTDCSKEFRCIFQFDTINKTIDVISVENAGQNTNIYFSFDNFVKQIDISPQTDEIYTVFNVAGGDDLDITGVNFGSRYLVNIDYPLSLIGGDLETKYHEYETFRESKRQSYIDIFKQAEVLYGKVSAIQDTRNVSSLANEKFSSELDYPTVDDLEKVRTNARTIISTIEELYTTNGTLDMDELNESDDAGIYHSLKDVVIPDVQTQIRNRNNNTTTTKDELVDDSTIWEMFGLYDLLDKQESLRQIIKTYTQAGYAADSPPDNIITQETWKAHHQEYLKKKSQYDELSALITKKQNRIKELQAQIKDLQTQMKDIGDSVKLETYFKDNPEYADKIKEMYKVSDYTNNNFIITDSDDGVSMLAEQKDLLEDAKKRLEIESHPQFKWEIDSANLYAMPEFKDYRDNIQPGDFIVIGYQNAVCAPKEYNKLRITEIDFDGLDIEKSFKLTFSNMIVTHQDVNDFESLIGDYIQSSVNSISIAAVNTSKKAAASATAALVKPYLEVQRLDAENANITNATIDDLKAQRGEFDTILANYATIDLANVKDGAVKNAMIDKGAVKEVQIADGSITDAKIVGLSADKLTAGTIDASAIDVTNLNAENITVGKINGKQIADGAIGQGNLTEDVVDNINLAKKSIQKVEVVYALGDSDETAPIDGWQADAPEWQPGHYIWQKTVTTLGDGTTASSEALCITGVQGEDSTVYELYPSVSVIVKDSDGVLQPTNVTATAQSKTGAKDAVSYSGRYTVEESADGEKWSVVYTSEADESSMPAYTPTSSAKMLKITLYQSGGTSTVLDVQTVPIVEDGSSPVTVQIDSSAGNIFKNNRITTVLTCHVYRGGKQVTEQVKSFNWKKYDSTGTEDTSFSRESAGNQITISAEDVLSRAIFGCQVTL